MSPDCYPLGEFYTPQRKATEFFFLTYKHQLDRARRLILPEARDGFPWERLAHLQTHPSTEGVYLVDPGVYYEGSYAGFEDVFSVPLNCSIRGEGQADPVVLGRQHLYLVERGGEWRVIDISPLEPGEL